MHWVDDDLFNHIEVRKTGQLAIVGHVLLDEVLASSWGAELMIVITELMMLFIGPVMECYNK
jgi:hypothetical protein